MKQTYRPLGKVVEILEFIGLDVTHQYEDLVFVTHNLFILKFSDEAARIDIYFNEEIEESKAQSLMGQLDALGELHGLSMSYKGAYSIQENEDETLSVAFFDLTET